MDTLIFSWEKKFGHGSSPGSGNLSSGFLSTSKFGHSFRPESVEEVTNTAVLSLEKKFGHGLHPRSGTVGSRNGKNSIARKRTYAETVANYVTPRVAPQIAMATHVES